MARPIVLSNGEMHVGINRFGQVHDFYFPYVGLENHAAGKDLRHRVGVWVDGSISWLDDGGWTIRSRYPHGSLIGHTIARNDHLQILFEFDDAVDAETSLFMRNIHVVNLANHERDIRLFMHQAFAIGDSRSNTDTAQYLPDSDAILHYRGRRAFVISGQAHDAPFDQYTTGLFGIEGREGTFRDAEDGELSMCNVEHGRVDSTIRFKLSIEGNSSTRVHYWITAGTSIREALILHKKVQRDGISTHFHSTAKWWSQWIKPVERLLPRIPKEYRDEFVKSAMIIRSHIDKRGAVLASTDTTMLNYSRDAYAYCWPRDASYVLWPLIRMGYHEEPLAFFRFATNQLHSSGYLMHKYQADGALGSSWHPYEHEDGTVAAPIQEDETALTLFVYAQFYQLNKDKANLDEFYPTFIKPMANFLANYIDERTGLPRPTYDLWEEKYLTTTYTVGATYGALQAAVQLAEVKGDDDSAVKWRSVAEDVYRAAHKHLYNPERKYFYKGLIVKNGEIEHDTTIDISAFFGAFMYGLFATDSDEVNAAATTIEETFNSNEVIGLPRYEHDDYRRDDGTSLGNYWFVTTLWMAQYYGEVGKSDKVQAALRWTLDHAEPTGVLSEQISPRDGASISVAPLAWSHAEFLSTLLDGVYEDSSEAES